MTKLLDLKETGKLMNKSPKALRMLISRDKFPFTKIGARIFTEKEELEKYLSLCRKTTAEQAAEDGGRDVMPPRAA